MDSYSKSILILWLSPALLLSAGSDRLPYSFPSLQASPSIQITTVLHDLQELCSCVTQSSWEIVSPVPITLYVFLFLWCIVPLPADPDSLTLWLWLGWAFWNWRGWRSHWSCSNSKTATWFLPNFWWLSRNQVEVLFWW